MLGTARQLRNIGSTFNFVAGVGGVGDGSSGALQCEETLTPLEKGLKFAKSKVTLQRALVVRQLVDFAHEVGFDDFVDQFLPIIEKELIHDPEIEVRSQLLDKFGSLTGFLIQSDPEKGYGIVISQLLPLIHSAILTDPTIRVRWTACQALVTVAPHIRMAERGHIVLPIVLSLAHDLEDSAARCRSIMVLAGLVESLGSDLCTQFVVPQLRCFCQDPAADVRKAAAAAFTEISRVAGEEVLTTKLLRAFSRLVTDTEWQVRKACAETIAALSEILPLEYRSACLLTLFRRLLEDENQFVKQSARTSLGPFIVSLRYPDRIPRDLLDEFLALASLPSMLSSSSQGPSLKSRPSSIDLLTSPSSMAANLFFSSESLAQSSLASLPFPRVPSDVTFFPPSVSQLPVDVSPPAACAYSIAAVFCTACGHGDRLSSVALSQIKGNHPLNSILSPRSVAFTQMSPVAVIPKLTSESRHSLSPLQSPTVKNPDVAAADSSVHPIHWMHESLPSASPSSSASCSERSAAEEYISQEGEGMEHWWPLFRAAFMLLLGKEDDGDDSLSIKKPLAASLPLLAEVLLMSELAEEDLDDSAGGGTADSFRETRFKSGETNGGSIGDGVELEASRGESVDTARRSRASVCASAANLERDTPALLASSNQAVDGDSTSRRRSSCDWGRTAKEAVDATREKGNRGRRAPVEGSKAKLSFSADSFFSFSSSNSLTSSFASSDISDANGSDWTVGDDLWKGNTNSSTAHHTLEGAESEEPKAAVRAAAKRWPLATLKRRRRKGRRGRSEELVDVEESVARLLDDSNVDIRIAMIENFARVVVHCPPPDRLCFIPLLASALARHSPYPSDGSSVCEPSTSTATPFLTWPFSGGGIDKPSADSLRGPNTGSIINHAAQGTVAAQFKESNISDPVIAAGPMGLIVQQAKCPRQPPNEKSHWRVRLAIAQQLRALLSLLEDPNVVQSCVVRLIFRLCKDPVASVRRVAFTTIPPLLMAACPTLWAYFRFGGAVDCSFKSRSDLRDIKSRCTSLLIPHSALRSMPSRHRQALLNLAIPTVLKESDEGVTSSRPSSSSTVPHAREGVSLSAPHMLEGPEVDVIRSLLLEFPMSPRHQDRLAYLRMCDHLVREIPRGFFQTFFLRAAVRLSGDKVKNVRWLWAVIFAPYVKRSGRLGSNALVVAAAKTLLSGCSRVHQRKLCLEKSRGQSGRNGLKRSASASSLDAFTSVPRSASFCNPAKSTSSGGSSGGGGENTCEGSAGLSRESCDAVSASSNFGSSSPLSIPHSFSEENGAWPGFWDPSPDDRRKMSWSSGEGVPSSTGSDSMNLHERESTDNNSTVVGSSFFGTDAEICRLLGSQAFAKDSELIWEDGLDFEDLNFDAISDGEHTILTRDCSRNSSDKAASSHSQEGSQKSQAAPPTEVESSPHIVLTDLPTPILYAQDDVECRDASSLIASATSDETSPTVTSLFQLQPSDTQAHEVQSPPSLASDTLPTPPDTVKSVGSAENSDRSDLSASLLLETGNYSPESNSAAHTQSAQQSEIPAEAIKHMETTTPTAAMSAPTATVTSRHSLFLSVDTPRPGMVPLASLGTATRDASESPAGEPARIDSGEHLVSQQSPPSLPPTHKGEKVLSRKMSGGPLSPSIPLIPEPRAVSLTPHLEILGLHVDEVDICCPYKKTKDEDTKSDDVDRADDTIDDEEVDKAKRLYKDLDGNAAVGNDCGDST